VYSSRCEHIGRAFPSAPEKLELMWLCPYRP
jgi:hypothetical protein